MLDLIVAFVQEVVYTFQGHDWGCGATAELLFNGDTIAACNALNTLAP